MPKLKLPEGEDMRVMMATVEIRAPEYVKKETIRDLLEKRLKVAIPSLNERAHLLSVTTRESGR
jgi:hypothetical protein